jgi:hypothetical protein
MAMIHLASFRGFYVLSQGCRASTLRLDDRERQDRRQARFHPSNPPNVIDRTIRTG